MAINNDQYKQVKDYLIKNNQQQLAGYVDQMYKNAGASDSQQSTTSQTDDAGNTFSSPS